MTPTQLTNVRVHGLGLTDDFLLNLSDRAQTAKVDGATPASYDLPPKVALEEAVLEAWDDARKAWARYQQHHTDAWSGWVRPLLKALDYAFPGGGAVGGRYAVSRLSETGDVPLHYAPPVVDAAGHAQPADLDRVTLHGTLRASPHGVMQGYLNATPEHLWGLVTNGEVLRVLRDNAQVTRPAYAEFNIGEMLRAEDARAFRVLWLLLHRSRLKGGKDSVLETWNAAASSEGVKARDSLRDGVKRAIEHLATGYLKGNPALYERVRSGELTPTTLYRACLNMVYQLVFLFVTEDRDLLFARDDQGDYVPDATTRERANYYLTRAMRSKAAELRGNPLHTDAHAGWERLLAYVRTGFPLLGLPALGSHLFQPNDLLGQQLDNRSFYEALRALSEITVDGARRPVNYAGLDSEELGSIYESLLELVPRIQPGPRFELQTLAGNERKTTGSYYTPTSLINLLLDSALDPVIEDAVNGKTRDDAIAALKNLKVIDPACGSGHFLIAAARRIGVKLAELEEETAQPSPAAQRRATRAVIAHCIYGADINPLAVELAKVALWLESQDAGKPLAFLDHRLRVGNSLLGTTPELMLEYTKSGKPYFVVPDDAFTPIEGDEKKYASAVKKKNKLERGQPSLLTQVKQNALTAEEFIELGNMPDETLEQVEAKEKRFNELMNGVQRQNELFTANAWCAAFVWPKYEGAPAPLTTDVLNAMSFNPDDNDYSNIHAEVQKLARQYRFLHPHLEFPDVFTAEQGGFDCVLGNPPWERVQFEEQDFFASIDSEVAKIANQNERKVAIDELLKSNAKIEKLYKETKRHSEGARNFITNSGKFPYTAFDKYNYYAIFTELFFSMLNVKGYSGIISKSGLIFDKLTSKFLEHLVFNDKLKYVLEFQNKSGIFPSVHRQERFVLATIGSSKNVAINMNCLTVEDARNLANEIKLSYTDIKLLSPSTFNIPMTEEPRSLKIMGTVYSRIGAISQKIAAGDFSIDRYINVSDFSESISTSSSSSDDDLGLLEGKMIGQFTIMRSSNNQSIETRNYISSSIAHRRNPRLKTDSYFVVARDITNKANERSVICSIIPNRITDYTLRVFVLDKDKIDPVLLCANLNSFILDYIARLKIGGTHLSNYIIEQLPILTTYDLASLAGVRQFIAPRVLELTYTAHDLAGFAADLGYADGPFTWNDERRFWLRAELDALYFILYGIERDDVAYIMDTFPIVRRKDEAAHGGVYRTKEAILSVFDELQQLGLERLGEYSSKVQGGNVAGGWTP
ncbi:hypothetical protein QR90_08595 [Deinococcus radiopugnans]|uniref:site-specific DNA-methyltransferase (adenine-specific) n=1 Tax=Deinococcus radiopugnans TaxID=57497 RepID=A0A0A7KKQ8_9DEIO|nr:N-6 DNA methylase [Deinococcus radiopugnans]AIZ45148.1 hypothetical protein QR90_08595 [Deinococcus radiopugnans]